MKITGTDDDDTLNGTDKDDTIRGLGGNDTIYSNGGADILYGGAGDDMIYIRQTQSYAYGEDGNDTFVAQEFAYAGNRTIVDGGDGIDTFDASAFKDRSSDSFGQFLYNYDQKRILTGGYSLNGVEVIYAPSYSEVEYDLDNLPTALTIFGGTGMDRAYTSRLAATVFDGGGGNDYVTVRATGSRAEGGRGNDYFELDAFGGVTGVRVDGGADRDGISVNASQVDLAAGYVDSNDGVHYLVKNVENAYVRGALNGAVISGTDGDNSLQVTTLTSSNSITIDGRGGNDFIYGSTASDKIFGGDGDDTILSGRGVDIIDGGAGRDDVSFENDASGPISLRLRDAGVTVVKIGGQAAAKLTGVEDFTGAYGKDNLVGNSADNTLAGSDGDDKLNGGKGNDTLYGDGGKDTLTGGDGADRIAFRYGEYDNGGDRAKADTITDFDKSEGDKIVLDFDANIPVNGTQDFTFIGEAKFSGAAGELQFDHVGKATFVSADMTGDGVADFTIKLSGNVALESTDFVL